MVFTDPRKSSLGIVRDWLILWDFPRSSGPLSKILGDPRIRYVALGDLYRDPLLLKPHQGNRGPRGSRPRPATPEVNPEPVPQLPLGILGPLSKALGTAPENIGAKGRGV